MTISNKRDNFDSFHETNREKKTSKKDISTVKMYFLYRFYVWIMDKQSFAISSRLFLLFISNNWKINFSKGKNEKVLVLQLVSLNHLQLLGIFSAKKQLKNQITFAIKKKFVGKFSNVHWLEFEVTFG